MQNTTFTIVKVDFIVRKESEYVSFSLILL